LKQINKQEARFITEYLKHGDRVKAWSTAYKNILVDEDRVYMLATQMMNAPHIKHELKKYLTESEVKYGLNKGMLIQELKNIAFFDIRSMMDEYGNLKKMKELQDAGKVINEIIISEDKDGTISRKIKVASKLTAIEMLNKMMGYNEPDKVRVVDGEGNDVKPSMTIVFKKFSNSEDREDNIPLLPNDEDEDEDSVDQD
jgi:uncharacterized protein YnzC (UPF0291/DUF896 family)